MIQFSVGVEQSVPRACRGGRDTPCQGGLSRLRSVRTGEMSHNQFFCGSIIRILSSRSCFTETSLGAPIIRSSAFWFIRSDEHTSELQSLMRISYAVCGLKKKKHSKHDS